MRERQQDDGRENLTLRRVLTLPLLTLYGLGVTIGAGIYVLVGAVVAEAGIYAWASFLVAAAVVAFTAFSYAELATRFPVSAGEAAYVEAGFGSSRLTVAVGLVVGLIGILSSAAIAIGAGAYLSVMIGLPVPASTIGIVLAMGLVAAWGIAESVTVAAAITIVEIGGLLMVISWGFSNAPGTALLLPDLIPPLRGAHWYGIGSGALLAVFAFVGFEDMANVAEEVKNPRRIIPFAVILTLAIAALLYTAATTAIILSVPIGDLAGSAAPLALVFDDAPQFLRDAFAVIAIVATINGILIQMIMASRVLYGLAKREYMPRWLAWVSPRTRTPVAATAAVVAAIAFLTQAFPIEALAARTSQMILLVFVLVNLALFRLKGRARTRSGHYFAVPEAVPLLGAFMSLGLLLTGFF